MYVISNDTNHNSQRLIYQSAKIDWTKKTHLSIWVYSSSPRWSGSEQQTYLDLQHSSVHPPCLLTSRSFYPNSQLYS